MLRCFTGSTGAENLALARLASSLEHSTLNAPMPLFDPSVHPVLKNLLLGADVIAPMQYSDAPSVQPVLKKLLLGT